jgi:hypothetical protein
MSPADTCLNTAPGTTLDELIVHNPSFCSGQSGCHLLGYIINNRGIGLRILWLDEEQESWDWRNHG